MSGLSIIIPSRKADNLVPCVQAIRAAGETCNVVVVDDGISWPDDRGPDWLGAYQVQYGQKPFVFARNVNIGIRAAGDDDVIVLNDDALLKTPHGFTAMRDAWLQSYGYGIVGAACNNVGNMNQWPQGHGQKPLRDEPRMLCFVCVLIPRRTINAVGLLDERYVDYGMDDDDYSLQVRNAGLKLGVFDGCFVDHGSLTSSYRGEAHQGGDFRPNMKRFIEKWGVDNWGKGRSTSQFKDLFPL